MPIKQLKYTSEKNMINPEVSESGTTALALMGFSELIENKF